MKKTLIILVLLLVGFSVSAYAETKIPGKVIFDHYDCNTYDYIIIETRSGYTTAQVYSGYSATYSGKLIYGDFHSYGFTEIYNDDGDEVGRIWVDDYMVSAYTANEWCFEE